MALVLTERDQRIQEILDELNRRGVDPGLTPAQQRQLQSGGMEAGTAPALPTASTPLPEAGRPVPPSSISPARAGVPPLMAPPASAGAEERTRPVPGPAGSSPLPLPSPQTLPTPTPLPQLGLESPPPPHPDPPSPEEARALPLPDRPRRRHPGLPGNSPLREKGFGVVTAGDDPRLENLDLLEKASPEPPAGRSRSFEEIMVDVAEFVEDPEPRLEHGDFVRKALGEISKGGGDLYRTIEKAKEANLPITAHVIDGLRAVGRGTAAIPETALRSIARLERDISAAASAATGIENPNLHAKLLDLMAEGIRRFSEEAFPENPALQGTVVNTVGEGLGSAVGFAAGGALAQRLLKGAGLAAEAMPKAIRATTGALGALIGGEMQAQEAEQHTSDPFTIRTAYYGGAAVGTSEIMGVGSSIQRMLGGAARHSIERAVRSAFIEAAEEALQEGFQAVAGNAIAKYLYDRNRDLMDGFMGSTATGGTVGAMFSLMVSALSAPGMRRRKFTRMDQVMEAVIADQTPVGKLKTPQTVAAEAGLTDSPYGQLPLEALQQLAAKPGELSKVSRQALELEIDRRTGAIAPEAEAETSPDNLSALTPPVQPGETPGSAVPAPTQMVEADNIRGGQPSSQGEIAAPAPTPGAPLGQTGAGSQPVSEAGTAAAPPEPGPQPGAGHPVLAVDGQLDFLEATDPLPGERRTDTETRKRYEDMSPEEMLGVILTDHKTGLGSDRRFDRDFDALIAEHEARYPKADASAIEAEKNRPAVAVFDLQGLGWINDNFGHPGGDALLKAFSHNLEKIAEGAAYRLGGAADEFAAIFPTTAAAEKAIGLVNEAFAEAEIEVTRPDGTIQKFKGGAFDAGIGRTKDEADRRLGVTKQASIERGERQSKGQRPRGLVEVAAPGQPDHKGEPAGGLDGPGAGEAGEGPGARPAEEVETSGETEAAPSETEEASGETKEASGETKEAETSSDEDVELRGFIDAVESLIASNARLDNKRVAELAKEHFGRVLGNARVIQDAVEAAAFRFISKTTVHSNPTREVEVLAAITARLNRQVVRDVQQLKFQQFSTPPAEAFTVVYAAGLVKWPMKARPARVLEPSAGTGSLATMARRMDARVAVNEIDERRRRVLRILKFDPTSLDAEQIDNLLPEGETFDVIVMNPPFSASGKRGTANTSANGNRHIKQALRRLRPGGRLVAIHGRGAHHGAHTQIPFWRDTFKAYNVRANLEIDGKHYGKFGTTFNNRIIVIDNTGPTPGSSYAEWVGNVIVTAADAALSPSEAIARLKGLAEEDIHARIQHQPAEEEGGAGAAAPVQPTAAPEPGPDPEPDPGRPAGRPGERHTGARSPRPGPKPDAIVDEAFPEQSATSEEGGLPGDEAGPGGLRPQVQGVGPAVVREPGDRSPVDGGAVTEVTVAAPASQELETVKPTSREFGEHEKAGVFAKYVVQKARVPGAKPHPANIVESATMASVDPPDVRYKPTLPREIIEDGKLSDVQLEAVAYAGQRFGSTLADGKTTAGAWIGDGTGVGKGREIAGVMYDWLGKGKKRAVWISISHDLHKDAERDAAGIGLPMKIIGHGKVGAKNDIPGEDGVLFTTYSFLRQGWKDGKSTRLAQMKKWLGEDFDGVIAFDEAHQMKNAVGTGRSEKEAGDSGSQQGAAGLALQAMFPKAKVLYVTATGATEARNMAFMSRLGLWGQGASFSDFRAFLKFMNEAGVGGMEMLARDLKAVGGFVSRQISYEGVEYETVTTPIEGDTLEVYDNMAKFWGELLIAWDSAGENSGQKSSGGSMFSQFYSTQQRFFLQIMTSFQLPQLMTNARKDLKEGRQVVISLLNTNEGATKDAVARATAEGLGLDEIDFSPRDMLVNLIERFFPVQQFEQVKDPETGNLVSQPVLDEAGNPVINRENLEKRGELIGRLSNLSIPENPLDAIVNEFGAQNVAEITGRKHRLEGKGKGRALVRRKIKGVPTKELNNYETQLFQEGKKRIAIISAAGSTGISLHSDVNAPSRRARRSFYALQLSWSADVQLQIFGRVHRSFQESPPIIQLMQTTIAGQKRLTNAVSKRLAGLGALTRGGRETLGGDLFRVEDLTDNFGQAALPSLYGSLLHNERLSGDLQDALSAAKMSTTSVLENMGVINKETGVIKDSARTNVDTFLNRIMVLPVGVQNAVFEEFYLRYSRAVAVAREAGTFDLGVQDVKADEIRHEGTEILHEDPISGAQTALVEVSGEVEQPRASFEEVKEVGALPTVLKVWGWFKQGTTSRPVFIVDKQRATGGAAIYAYNTRGGNEIIPVLELNQKWVKIPEAEAKSLWEKHLKEQPRTKRQKVHLLTGAVFPVVDRVMSGNEDKLKVKRATTESGERFVGIEIPAGKIEGLRQRFGIGTPLAQATPEQIVGFLLDNESIIEMDNGWTLAARRIGGEQRIELVVPNVTEGKGREIVELFKFDEEILQFRKRFFIPAASREEAARRLGPLLDRHKAVRDQTMSLTTEDFSKPDDDEGGGAADRPKSRAHQAAKARHEKRMAERGRGAGNRAADQAAPSSGLAYEDHPIELTQTRRLRPVEMPELVQLVKDLTGNVPTLKKLPKSLGYFKNGIVVLDFRLFKNVAAAAKTLAHEIGHLIDFLPDATLQRGNLLGRLHSLRDFTRHTFYSADGKKLENKTIRDELIGLSRWWKPFEDTDPPNYVRYRKSARELYADALSVLLNSPGSVERLAPTFFEVFFEELGRKPAVNQAYLELQALLGGKTDDVVRARRQRAREAFDAGEERRRELEQQALGSPQTIRAFVKRLWQNTRIAFDDKNAVILEKVGKFVDESKLPHDQNPRFLLEEAGMSDSKNHQMILRMGEEVIDPFVKVVGSADEARTLFGEYLLNRRVRDGDREALANPQGITPNTADATLRQMKSDLGDLAWSQLERSMNRFHQIAFELSREATAVGVYSQERFVNTILPNQDTYATFEVIDFMDRTIGAGLKHQRGTFRDVTNPFSSTLLKLSTLNRLIAYNRAKKSVVDLWQQNRLGIARSEEIKGQAGETLAFKPNANPELAGRIELLEDGKVVGYDVDPYVATAFKRESPEMLVAVMRVLHVMNHKVFHPLFITWNVMFHTGNVQRDVKRTWKAGGTVRSLLVELVKAAPSAHRRASGVTDKVVSEMISNAALDVPFTDAATGIVEDDTYERMLRRMALGEEIGVRPKRGAVGRFVMAPLDFLQYVGDFLEASTKIAGWNVRRRGAVRNIAAAYVGQVRGFKRVQLAAALDLKRGADGMFLWPEDKLARFYEAADRWVREGKPTKGLSVALLNDWKEFYRRRMNVDAKRISYEVRNFVGTPNWRTRGHYTYQTNALFLYSNVAVQGYKADATLATDPRTRGGWWMKTAMVGIIPKLMMMAAQAGLFGDELEEWFGKIGEYDKQNNLIVPLGWKGEGPDREAVYLRMRQDESERFLTGLMWNLFRVKDRGAKGFGSVFDFGADMFPGFSPPIELAAAWATYVAGGNPRDSFLEREIIPRTAAEAGGAAALEPMLWWTVGKTGLFRVRRSDLEGKAGLEWGYELGRQFGRQKTGMDGLIRSSNFGDVEKEFEIQDQQTREAARFRLSLPENATTLVRERSRLQARKERLTRAEALRLVKLNRFNREYLRLRGQIKELEEQGKTTRADAARRLLERSAARYAP